ncbi:hypothetical protein EPL05_03890 [Mucilaginibacter gilvus]|uniref:Uncharacterized protein n=1 Tax=Mucilaginibacter gilvus TaxID=2305909 RepID=A0A444MTH5_9SPHI|nr:hypothetical protein EPL05_03890 [Mucilaginibacter gilvus]
MKIPDICNYLLNNYSFYCKVDNI